MGKVTIVSGGEDGLYTATPNFDITAATNELEKLNDRLTKLQIDIRPSAILKQSSARAALDSAIAATNAAIVDYQGEPSSDNEKALKAATAAEIAARTAHSIAVGELNRTDIEIASVNARINQIHALTADANNPVQVWCADVTENLTGEVAAIEINSDQRDGILIRPGHEDGSADYTPARDGIVTLPVAMSPSSTFFNWALKPCIQRTRPVYRSATIISIDDASNTCSIQLHESQSMAAEHVLNDTPVMSGVPISYMTCNAAAFNIGDEVVVEFSNYDETQPTVIGFVSNPKRCHIIVGESRSLGIDSQTNPVKWVRPNNPEFIGVEGAWQGVAVAISRDRKSVAGNVNYVPVSGDPLSHLTYPFVWTEAQGIVVFEFPYSTEVYDISSDGSVLVGQTVVPDGEFVRHLPCRITSGSIELLEPPGDGEGEALAVSDDGNAVMGLFNIASPTVNQTHVYWPSGGGVVVLPLNATDISGDGLTIVGSYFGSACKWTLSGGLQLLGIDGVAMAISANGSAIAIQSTSGFKVWSEATGFVDVELPESYESYILYDGLITGISADGKAICGNITYAEPDLSSGINRGFYWTRSTGVILLEPEPGYLSSLAHDIV